MITADVAVVTDAVLDGLDDLPGYRITVVAPGLGALDLTADAVILDARTDPTTASRLAPLLAAPTLLWLSEDTLGAIDPTIPVDAIAVGEVSGAQWRLRLARLLAPTRPTVVATAALTIDAASYRATLAGQPLELTYTEFELLRYLASEPGRVHSREELLAEVWGYDYFGGTRTVDVHVRRLRAKLGPEHDAMIETVRNVGYRFSPR